MILTVGAAVMNTGLLASLHPQSAGLVVGLNAAVAACATIGYVAVAGFARRYPEAILFLVLVVVDLATVGIAMLRPEMGAIVAGYLLVLPMVVALVLPWATRVHVAWLCLHAVLTLAGTSLAPLNSAPERRSRTSTSCIPTSGEDSARTWNVSPRCLENDERISGAGSIQDIQAVVRLWPPTASRALAAIPMPAVLRNWRRDMGRVLFSAGPNLSISSTFSVLLLPN